MLLGDLAPTLRQYGLPCWRKARHETEQAAKAHMWNLLVNEREKDAERINVYRCPHCRQPNGEPYWHVGHSEFGTASLV